MEKMAEANVNQTLLAAVKLSEVDLRLAASLDEAERQLAAAFSSSAGRDRFLAGRIALRVQAADIAGVSPHSLRADYLCTLCGRDDRVHGMPVYQLPSGPPIRASLSRSQDWCLVAASIDRRVLALGVDLEVGPSAAFEGFQTVAMSEHERHHLKGLEPFSVPHFQTVLWTRKEAVLKALGQGLAADPSQVDVAGPVPVVAGRTWDSQQWLIESVSPGSVGLPDDGIATLAVLFGQCITREGGAPMPDPSGHDQPGR
jgi:4'-phosphopantetheinyl transferase